jgi:hypothetical protein
MANSTKYTLVVIVIIILISGLALIINSNYTTKNKPATTNAPVNNNAAVITDTTVEGIVCGKTNPLYCNGDSDCICADASTQYPGCFTGNKAYYEKCEDKSRSCSDHCQGWAQPPVKCINNKCSNSYDRTGS